MFDRSEHRRRSMRLRGHDYAQADAYFVTVCAHDRACLFGAVVDAEMRPNDAGRLVVAEWEALPGRFPAIELDAFVLMPNHLHGIIVIRPPGLVRAGQGATVGAGLVPARAETTGMIPTTTVGAGVRATTRVARTGMDDAPVTLGDVVGAFNSSTTVRYTRGITRSGWPPFRGRLWQRNYYEHIVRDEASLSRIRQYIQENPARWTADRDNPEAVSHEPDMAAGST